MRDTRDIYIPFIASISLPESLIFTDCATTTPEMKEKYNEFQVTTITTTGMPRNGGQPVLFVSGLTPIAE